jgi:hypothetical protein
MFKVCCHFLTPVTQKVTVSFPGSKSQLELHVALLVAPTHLALLLTRTSLTISPSMGNIFLKKLHVFLLGLQV